MNAASQIIERDGKPEYAIVPYAEYMRMMEPLEELQDIADADEAMRGIAAGEEVIPGEVVRRLALGESPLKVWRVYRGLSQQALGERAGVGKSHISQLEAGRKTASVAVLTKIAVALGVDTLVQGEGE